VKRWHVRWSGEYLIFARHGIDIDRYPSVQDHLTRFRPQLTPRENSKIDTPGRKPGRYAWYEIQDNVAFYPYLDRPKIVVPCIAYYCEFALDCDGLWPNNKVILIASDDPCLVAVLNSRINWWLMSQLMIKMKDDALSVDVHVLSQLPIPVLSPSVRSEMQRLVTALATPERAGPSTLDLERSLNVLVEEAFRLTSEEREILLSSLPPRDPLVAAKHRYAVGGATH
jgi:adenine-specific DNA-methyltransferase